MFRGFNIVPEFYTDVLNNFAIFTGKYCNLGVFLLILQNF